MNLTLTLNPQPLTTALNFEGTPKGTLSLRGACEATLNGTLNPLEGTLIDPLKEPRIDPLKEPRIDPLKEPLIDPLKEPLIKASCSLQGGPGCAMGISDLLRP